MRTPRIAILVLFFAASLFLFCRFITTTIHGTGPAVPLATTQKSSFRTFFSFTAPFSLFPPSAAISLTDDNSTFFAARPAAFGPPLPSDGLSGQLWIGSGFTDDSLQEGEGEGELGCSDVAGWEGVRPELALKAAEQGSAGDKLAGAAVNSKNPKRAGLGRSHPADRKATSKRQPGKGAGSVDDGTDDYLHQGLQQTSNAANEPTTNLGSSHADIQSIQETAEITGKIVLLSRGGCGFLEKVKWAQRRGAIALIVGDNQKGGPLIQMFARGNVDNVTIPSVFTSRTTAHLLSSLMQPGSFIEDILDENGNPVLKVQQSGKGRKGKKTKDAGSMPPSTPKVTPKPKSGKIPTAQEDAGPAADRPAPVRRSWISRLFWWGSDSSAGSDRSRPPSSGRLDWVIVDEWSDEKDKAIKNSLDKASKNGGDSSTNANTPADGFRIGVQDWRDPDLVGSSPATDASSPSKGNVQSAGSSASSKQAGKSGGPVADANGPKGGSITPGSGEYASEIPADAKSDGSGSQGGLMSKIFGDDDGVDFSNDSPAPSAAPTPIRPPGDGDGSDREGLWVTITPTSGASPFFDTLLVLVVSPLITLTVVYALLILRAKIRRRRWRAPKSVVERLPVRTYHTVAPTPPSQSPRNPSPTSSSPTTPLLQGSSRSRPRSRTTTGVPESSDLLRADNALQTPKPNPHEKTSPHLSSEWKKYMGRQVECVVCLEEYVDGVSRVMSLPCGHEFHVECITPWLTTRRRTCPICKGDVVRSLARGSPSSPRYEPYFDDSDDDPEASGSGVNRSPGEGDVERGGILAPTPRRGQANHAEWFTILASTLGSNTPLGSRREPNHHNQ
ncbi:hypothetical protein QBC34DRAFT_292717 [Podospora aff. communis PSN243]|uniref:RING-type domain-containing protein n=1 Tax=Podospora aff. communis PSN243 TaxID=3040156 RepID=A0AAV9GWX9_9PEZI|nr:hypothetical protein QBC34DRAFT_292717 [Podospora aff. communis PSN243]